MKFFLRSADKGHVISFVRSSERRGLCLGIAACCLLDTVAALVFHVWHPASFGAGGDFYNEALPPLKALAHGHILTFLKTGPAYLGAVVLEAIVALPAIWLHAPASTVYFFASLPAILAAPAFVWWTARHRGETRLHIADLPLALIVFNPVTLCCLGFGHPEDILTACLVLAAVLESQNGSARKAGVLIGLAIIAKPWAVIAAPLIWAAAPDLRRTAIATIATAGAFWIPVIIYREVSLGSNVTAGSLGAGVGIINSPEQLLYFFGAQSLVARNAHVLIPLAAAVLALVWHRCHRAELSEEMTAAALWLVALLLLVRCAFDPWDNPYYHLPFLMALMALESRSRRRLPVLSIAATIVAYILVQPGAASTAHPSTDARAYAAVAIPTMLLLAARAYAPERWVSQIRLRWLVLAPAGIGPIDDSGTARTAARTPETGDNARRNEFSSIAAKP